MIVKALKSIANALTGKKEDDTNQPHPLDGPTKRAQVQEPQKLNEVAWPFPTARPTEEVKPKAKAKKATPAKKTKKENK